MSPMLNPQLNNLSKDIYSLPEKVSSASTEMQSFNQEGLKFSPEETASRAIADAINDLPGNQENIVLASQKTLSAAENLSPIEFDNRAKRLEDIFQDIREQTANTPDDMSVFYNLVYKGAQELRRDGDFYSLDALHDGAVEIAKGEKKLLS